MEMSKRLRAVIALVLVVCVLLPATAFPLQYAPNAPRKDVIDGHGEPPITARTEVSKATSSPQFVLLTVPGFGIHFSYSYSNSWFVLWWY